MVTAHDIDWAPCEPGDSANSSNHTKQINTDVNAVRNSDLSNLGGHVPTKRLPLGVFYYAYSRTSTPAQAESAGTVVQSI
jgi:hypothetical protein